MRQKVVWVVAAISFLVGCSDPSQDDPTVEVGCRLNSDCPSGQECNEGECVEVEGCVGESCPCTDDGGCPNGLLCDTSTGECFVPGCDEDLDCALGQVCDAGRCLTDLEADRDRDGVPDSEDLCPDDVDTDQSDNDGDGQGDVCDDDDDNDSLPDSVDNCQNVSNNEQFDADGDGVGNECDEDWRGTTVAGRLAAPGFEAPDFSTAEVTLGGQGQALTPNNEGRFAFEEALLEGGAVEISVVWPGFVAERRVFNVPGGIEAHDVGTIEMRLEATGEEAVTLEGRVELAGEESHGGVFVEARFNNRPFATSVTTLEGTFALQASRVDYTLALQKVGFVPLQVDVVWSEARERFEVGGEALQASVLRLSREPPSGVIEVRVDIQPDWIPEDQRHVRVVIRGTDFANARQQVFHQQTEVFSSLPFGTFAVEATREGFAPALALVTLSPDAPTAEVLLDTALTNLAGARLDLAGQILAEADLRDAAETIELRFGNLSGVVVAPFSDLSDLGLNLSGVNLSNASMAGVNLDGVDLSGANLFGAELGCFTGDPVPEDEIQETITACVSLDGANLTRTNLAAANLAGASFVGLDPELPGDEPCAEDAPRPEVVLDGVTFSQTDLRGADLRGVLLRESNLSGALLQQADFSRACLQGSQMPLSDLSEASFDRADLSGASMINAVLDRTLLRGSILVRASLNSAVIEEASFGCIEGNCTDLSGANLNGASLVGANFAGATLDGASLLGVITGRSTRFPNLQPEGCEVPEGCSFEDLNACQAPVDDACRLPTTMAGASLRGAELVGVLFSEAALNDADFTDASMDNTVFIDCLLGNAVFQNAGLSSANLSGEDLRSADLSEAVLANASLFRAQLSGANLSNANLSNANLIEADLEGADLTDASMVAASLRGVVLNSASLTGIDLRLTDASGIDFTSQDLTGASFVDANITGARFINADLTRANLTRADLVSAENMDGAIYLETLCFNGLPNEHPDNAGTCFHPASTGNVDASILEVLKTYSVIRGDLSFAGGPPEFIALRLPVLRHIEGDLIMDQDGFSSISLPALETIGGDVIIRRAFSLESFDMNALETIGGELVVEDNERLGAIGGMNSLRSVNDINITNNPAIETIEFGALASVNDIIITDNVALSQVGDLPELRTLATLLLNHNDAMIDMGGFNALESARSVTVGGDDLSALERITGLRSLSTSGSLTVHFHPNLVDISGLASLTSIDNLSFAGFPGPPDLNALTSLTSINQNFSLENLSNVRSLEGLGSLTTITGFRVSRLASLTSLDGLSLPAEQNTALITLSALPSLSNLSALQTLTSIHSLSIVACPALSDLSGLSTLTTVLGNLSIGLNEGLTNLSGLDALTTVEFLIISAMPSLDDLSGADNLTDIVNIQFNENPTLVDLRGLESLRTLENLQLTDNNALQSLRGVENLTRLDRITLGENPVLRSLDGLENLTEIATSMVITNNPQLSSCLIDDLQARVGFVGSSIIFGNGLCL